MQLFNKMRGDNAVIPPAAAKKTIALAWLGGFITIALLVCLSNWLALTLILGSFGASCVLVFGFPDAPFSQPRNVIAGHFLSSLIGLVCLQVFGHEWWSVAIAVGTAIAVMMRTRTVHPPAGSNPVIIFLGSPAWSFLLFPTLLGAIAIVLVALFYHNLSREARWPKYW